MRPNGELPSDPQQADRQAPTRARSYAKARLAVHHRSACPGVKALRNTSPARRQAAKLCYRFGPLTPFRALREPDRRRRDEERLCRSEQRTGNKPKPPLDSKSPIQVRILLPSSASLVRTCLPLLARQCLPAAPRALGVLSGRRPAKMAAARGLAKLVPKRVNRCTREPPRASAARMPRPLLPVRRNEPISRGTGRSNPSPSSGESGANSSQSKLGPLHLSRTVKPRRRRPRRLVPRRAAPGGDRPGADQLAVAAARRRADERPRRRQRDRHHRPP